MQKCNPKPITIKTDSKHTISAQSTRIIYASIPVSNEHPTTGTIRPLPQFEKCAKLIVAPAITTARDKKVAIKIDNTTDFPYTISTDTKLAELQILKPEETKMIRPVDIAALNLLTDHDDVVTAKRWKPNGKLRLLGDLRKINALIADDYINNNHPISTLSDVAQHLAGKNFSQTRLLPSLSLSSNGRSKISRITCF